MHRLILAIAVLAPLAAQAQQAQPNPDARKVPPAWTTYGPITVGAAKLYANAPAAPPSTHKLNPGVKVTQP
jgi:hypothetical protein